MTHKTKLKEILESVDNDMQEEIMELHHYLNSPSFEDLTENEAKDILKTLKEYQKFGCTIQGESIQHLNLAS